MRYESIPPLSRAEVLSAVERNDPAELLRVVLSAALHDPDPDWAMELCFRLATHPHWNVRGNAMLGLGHIARLHERLDRTRAQAILLAGLADSHEYVRGQADGATSDVEHYLGWRFRSNPIQDWHDGVPVPGVKFLRNDRVEIRGGTRGVGQVGALVGLLTTEPEVQYLIDLRPDDPDSTELALTVAEQHLRPID